MGKLFKPVFFLTTILALSFLTACVEKPKEGDVNNNQYQTKKDADGKRGAEARKRAQELTNKNINPKLANQVKARDLKRAGDIGANTRFNVPVTDQQPYLGEKDALITIVEYSEFECPFCSRVEPTLHKILDEYKGKVKLVWKNNPLGFHKRALPAAESAYTIFKLKGNEAFWKAHETYYKNSKNLTDEFLTETAQSIGVDMAQYKEAMEKGTYRKVILQEQSESNRLGARGTPGFFINGKFLSGAQPFENFKKIIDEELVFAEQTLKNSGVSKAQLYNEIVKNGLTAAPMPERRAQPEMQQQRPGSPDPNKAYFNEIDGFPFMGEKDALITIVEYSDYQCPFCSRAEPTLKKIMEEYKGKVKIVWKDNPLGFHKDAMPAAIVAHMIFQEKGNDAFWKAHDFMYENGKSLTEENFVKIAKDLGVSEDKVKATLQNEGLKAKMMKSQQDAAKVGANGTPAFFINGRFLSGAQPFENFKKIIDEELVKAEEMVKNGVSKSDIYKNIMAKAERTVPMAPAQQQQQQQQQQRPGSPDPAKAYFNDIDGFPFMGEKDALITIVEYSDYQCPFCSRAEPTLKKIMEEYKGKVKIVWKDNPLGFHKDAMPAAIVAHMIFQEKGNDAFWKAHDFMYENGKSLTEENFVKIAKDLGVSEDKVKATLQNEGLKAKMMKSQQDAAKVGANGTPAFFINGRFLSGAQPFENFKKIIDEELVKAEEMVKNGVSKSNIYKNIMSKAEKIVASAPAMNNQMPEDNKVYDVKSSPNAAAFGPKDAKILISEFSEFQCPFCVRVNPTLAKIKEKYAGKVRIEFRHMPLPFHNNAMNAAKASIAANKQGKFWEYHDLLFVNQKNLSEDELIGYANKIGLNLKQFEADMKDPKTEEIIKADMDVARQVGANGTPTFFINGKKLIGAQPYEAFEKKIEEALKN